MGSWEQVPRFPRPGGHVRAYTTDRNITTGSAIPTDAVAGSKIAKKPNKMNSTPAKLYQPVKLLAVSIAGRSVAICTKPA